MAASSPVMFGAAIAAESGGRCTGAELFLPTELRREPAQPDRATATQLKKKDGRADARPPIWFHKRLSAIAWS
jgi:hypothetical protein